MLCEQHNSITSETPWMLVRTAPSLEGGLDFFVEDSHSAVSGWLDHLGMGEVGANLATGILGQDHHLVVEWMEFALCAKEMPYISIPVIEDEAKTTGHFIQRFSFLDNWVCVTVECCKKTDRIVVFFEVIESLKSLTGIWHMMIMQQQQEMSRMVTSGGRWAIDCYRHRIFLSQTMAQSLNLGNRPIIISMQRFLDTVHMEDRSKVVEHLDQIGEHTATYYSRHTTQGGTSAYLYNYAFPLYDEKGQMARIIGRSENVTDKMISWEQLAVSEERFLQIAAHSGELFLVADKEARLSYVSPDMAKLLGTESDHLVGRHLSVLLDYTDDKETMRAKVEEILASGMPGTLRCRFQRPGGDHRWLEFTAFTINNSKGRHAEIVALARDITGETARQGMLQYLSQHDGLTRTYNRSFLWELLEELHRAEDQVFSIILFDINGLRLINDVFGYQRGDQVLSEVAGVIRRTFLHKRHIARMGGDEFAVVVYHDNMVEMEHCCGKVDAYCKRTNRRMLPLSVSWGIVSSTEGEPSPQEMLNLAESRMLQHKLLQNSSVHSSVVFSLKEALHTRNLETADHIARMEEMVEKIGRRLNLSPSEHDRLTLLASMHDIGKIAVPDSIINKPGKLDEAERRVMQAHAETGYRIAMASQVLSGIAGEILCHHERWDGSGYPQGRKEEEIPLLSRIIAVVDAYDVMTHARVYKKPVSHEEAVAELRRCAGTQFSPEVVDLFLEVMESHFAQ